MLNIRTIILSVALVTILMLMAGLMTARSETVYNNGNGEVNGIERQEQSANPVNSNSASSYRSQFGACLDVSVQELAACRETSNTPARAYRQPLDECFDVPLIDAVDCRDEDQGSIQLFRSPPDECFDVPLTEAPNCKSASQSVNP